MEEAWKAKVLDWAAGKVISIITSSPLKRVSESFIYHALAPRRGMQMLPDLQCLGYCAIPRRQQLGFVRAAIRRLMDHGKIIVVQRYPGREHQLIGPGDEELVFELGGVLDELASVLSRPEVSLKCPTGEVV